MALQKGPLDTSPPSVISRMAAAGGTFSWGSRGRQGRTERAEPGLGLLLAGSRFPSAFGQLSGAQQLLRTVLSLCLP